LSTLVVAHDAGGAELVAAWLRRGQGAVQAWVAGPAARVFAAVVPEVETLAEVPDVGGYDFVLCGSSGAAEHEREVVRAACAAGVRSAVWLDHWVNYRVRFDRLPDELWVCDEYAARIARETVPGPPVHVQGNPYIDDQVTAIQAFAGPRAGRVLYVTEPTSRVAALVTGDPLGWGYDELGALRGYLERRPAGVPVAVRRHPSEPPEKYAALLEEFGVQASEASSLAEAIAGVDTVVGCDTMAMAVALAAGRRVISAIPPGGRPLSLPFTEIERLYGDGQA
jgi:hypothetical protein